MTLIKNTAATPVNGNNLQASYGGGDGNDLTLTVGSISSGTTRNATHRIAPSSMPLLLSLKTGLLTKAYKHGAPNGALRHCQVCQLFNRARWVLSVERCYNRGGVLFVRVRLTICAKTQRQRFSFFKPFQLLTERSSQTEQQQLFSGAFKRTRLPTRMRVQFVFSHLGQLPSISEFAQAQRYRQDPAVAPQRASWQ